MTEFYVSAQTAYEIHRDELIRLLGEPVKFWHELDWREQDSWQEYADELNEARREKP